MSNTDGGQSPTAGGLSQIVTVNQNGVIALNAVLAALTLLNTTLQNSFPNWVNVPATATSTGTAGQVAYDATHFYVCISTNVWVRATLATF